LAAQSFQKGIDAKSLIAIQASKPGGLMAVGSCPNKKSSAIFATLEEDADALGLDKARCFGKLNRKEGKDPYHKPKVIVACMLELFNIGGDGTPKKLMAKICMIG
jgi:hypothetical protein